MKLRYYYLLTVFDMQAELNTVIRMRNKLDDFHWRQLWAGTVCLVPVNAGVCVCPAAPLEVSLSQTLSYIL